MPKTLAWAFYLFAWVANRIAARDFGGRWDLWDSLLGAWLASGFVVALFAGLEGKEWRGAMDLFRYGSVAWLLKRSRLAAREVKWVLAALVGSAVIGAAWGYVRVLNGAPSLQLNSVGHVNHTAIYLAIIFGICASWFVIRPLFSAPAATAIMLSVFVAASRAAAAVCLITLAVLGAARGTARAVVLATTVLVVAVAAALIGQASIVRKHIEMVESGQVLAYREGVWRIAHETWRQYPIFGVGMGNFHLITEERSRAARLAEGRDYKPTHHFDVGHAHSLYLGALAERGIVGFVPLVAVLIAWLVSLIRGLGQARRNPDAWLIWGSAAGAWIVTTAVGFANSTLHHEHGILAALLLGLWLSRQERNQSTVRASPSSSL